MHSPELLSKFAHALVPFELYSAYKGKFFNTVEGGTLLVAKAIKCKQENHLKSHRRRTVVQRLDFQCTRRGNKFTRNMYTKSKKKAKKHFLEVIVPNTFKFVCARYCITRARLVRAPASSHLLTRIGARRSNTQATLHGTRTSSDQRRHIRQRPRSLPRSYLNRNSSPNNNNDNAPEAGHFKDGHAVEVSQNAPCTTLKPLIGHTETENEKKMTAEPKKGISKMETRDQKKKEQRKTQQHCALSCSRTWTDMHDIN